MTRMEKERIKYRRFGDFTFACWFEHKFTHINPLSSPVGVDWVGWCSLHDEQAVITCQGRRWAVIGLRIDSTRRIQVLLLDNNLRYIGVIDSILALEDIERPEGVEHYDLLLSKLKREVVMEEGRFA